MSFLLELNWTGLLFGAAAAYALGCFWYSPYTFEIFWARILKTNPNPFTRAGLLLLGFPLFFLSLLIATIFHKSLVLAHHIIFLQATILALFPLSTHLFTGRPILPWVVNTTYRLLAILIIVCSLLWVGN